MARLVASNAYLAFARAVELFVPPSAAPQGIHRLADIAASATVTPDASIGAFVSIGDGAHVGARSIIYPHATIGAGQLTLVRYDAASKKWVPAH